MEIMTTVARGRASAGKSVNDFCFVLNLKDQYAGAALDAYVQNIQADRQNDTNPTVRNAMKKAVEIRTQAALEVTTHLPG